MPLSDNYPFITHIIDKEIAHSIYKDRMSGSWVRKDKEFINLRDYEGLINFDFKEIEE